MPRRPAPAICPVCGDAVPPRALACPECGADYESGWREDADGIDAAGGNAEEFDYDEFVREEFGPRVKPPGLAAHWWVTAMILLGALLAGYFAYVRLAFSH